MTCPECGSRLTATADAKHYQRTGDYRYFIICTGGCSERAAVVGDAQDDNIIENASEQYWLGRWANA